MSRSNINVKLETVSYDGPFELLFALIDKNEIDIYDIPISDLTEQYLEYINSMDDISEFILMAAMLLEIKSKMLLPRLKEKTGEEADPRDELVRKLEEYKHYKEIAEVFKDRETDASRYYFRAADPDSSELYKTVSDKSEEVKDILDGITLDRLLEIFNEIINRRELRTDKVRSSFNSVEKDSFTIDKKICYINDLLGTKKRILFTQVFDECGSKIEKVVTFLAVLELIRRMMVKIDQENTFGEIFITSI